MGGLLSLAMLVGGGFLALAGLGYVGSSGDTSSAWALGGAVVAGLGIALLISLVQRR